MNNPLGASLVGSTLALFVWTTTAHAQVCYELPFSNPNLMDGWGSTCCGRSNPHRGVDFPQGTGTPVPAVADGVVDRVTWTNCLGNVVVLRHADGMYSGYAHLSAITVSEGAQVRRRDTVGRVGSTGTCTTGPHLHLTISPNAIGYTSGATVDPYVYINEHTTCDCDRTVDTGRVGSFTFSCDGPNEGLSCTNVDEPGDPTTWEDNFVCTSEDHGLRWSYRGPIEGMECVGVHESSSPSADVWADNFLCSPPQAAIRMEWSSAGPISGRWCLHWNEPQAQAQSWADNFLCVRTRSDYSNAGFTFSSDGPNDGQVCVSVEEPSDPDSWADNFLCTDVDEGLVWSFDGPVEGMRCTHILETSGNDGEGWDDNWLCVPEGSRRELHWSSRGPIEELPCVRFNETSDPNGSWKDNWLCIGERPPEPEADAGSPDPEDASLDASHDAAVDAEQSDTAQRDTPQRDTAPDATEGSGGDGGQTAADVGSSDAEATAEGSDVEATTKTASASCAALPRSPSSTDGGWLRAFAALALGGLLLRLARSR